MSMALREVRTARELSSSQDPRSLVVVSSPGSWRCRSSIVGTRGDFRTHLYGDTRNLEVPFPCQRHGQLPPSALNRLYNSTITGLALSFTNITLVATEMLAAGNVPVVNDNEFARAVLTSPDVVWSDPTTGSLASALSEDRRTRRHRGACSPCEPAGP